MDITVFRISLNMFSNLSLKNTVYYEQAGSTDAALCVADNRYSTSN